MDNNENEGFSTNTSYQYDNGDTDQPGKGNATASLVLGIISLIVGVISFGTLSIVSVVLSIIGLILASSAKKKGCEDGSRKGGFITNLISIIVNGIALVGCISCLACSCAAAGSADFGEVFEEYEDLYESAYESASISIEAES